MSEKTWHTRRGHRRHAVPGHKRHQHVRPRAQTAHTPCGSADCIKVAGHRRKCEATAGTKHVGHSALAWDLRFCHVIRRNSRGHAPPWRSAVNPVCDIRQPMSGTGQKIVILRPTCYIHPRLQNFKNLDKTRSIAEVSHEGKFLRR